MPGKFSNQLFKKTSTYGGLALACLALLFFFFGKVLIQPNAYSLSPGGDGLKNYFTPAYYLKYDEGLHFSGMNYPYGEHVVYTDNQPALSLVLNFIDNHLFEINDYTVGILNLLLFLSLIPCCWLLFWIMRFYGLPAWYAGVSAVLITFLSPQLSRFSGHYALGYALFVPLVWYLLIRFGEAKKQLLYAALIVATITFFGLIHIYYILIAGLFVGSFSVVAFLKAREKSKCIRPCLLLVLTAALPLIFIQAFISQTDPIADRPDSPYGFFTYRASFESVFLPSYGHVHDFLKNAVNLRAVQSEGLAYVGLAGLFVLAFAAVRFGRNRIKRGPFGKFKTTNAGTDLSTFVWASVLVLLFSMAIPFRFGMEFLLDVFSPLKQFRSPGRFAWVFYYVFCVYTAFFFFLLYKKLRFRKMKTAAVLLLLVVWGISVQDVLSNVGLAQKWGKFGSQSNFFHQNNLDYTNQLEAAGYAPGDFQAILALPYFLEGSEKLYITRSGTAIMESFKAAYDTGLPLIQGMMSRTSLQQTLSLAQLLSSDLTEKTLLPHLNDKPILLLALDREFEEAEQRLVAAASLITKFDGISLYRLPVSAFHDQQELAKRHFEKKRGFLFHDETKGVFISDSSAWVFQNSFDVLESGFFNPSPQVAISDKNIVFEGKVPVADTVLMEASVWVKALQHTTAFPVFYCEKFGGNGDLLERAEANPKFSTEIFQDYVRVKIRFYVNGGAEKVRLLFRGENAVFDELLVKPAFTDVYHNFYPNGDFWMNNIPLVPASVKHP